MVILPIIFPETDRANFISSASVKCFVATARATVGLLWLIAFRDVFKHVKSLHSALVNFGAGMNQVLVNGVTGNVESHNKGLSGFPASAS